MNLPKAIAKVRFHYHLNMLDWNNVLNQLHVLSDEKTEAKNKNHTMTIVNDILPRLNLRLVDVTEKEEP